MHDKLTHYLKQQFHERDSNCFSCREISLGYQLDKHCQKYFFYFFFYSESAKNNNNCQKEAHNLNQRWMGDISKKNILSDFKMDSTNLWSETWPKAIRILFLSSVISEVWTLQSPLISCSHSFEVKLNFHISKWSVVVSFMLIREAPPLPPIFPYICGWALFWAHSSFLDLDVLLKGLRCGPLMGVQEQEWVWSSGSDTEGRAGAVWENLLINIHRRASQLSTGCSWD